MKQLMALLTSALFAVALLSFSTVSMAADSLEEDVMMRKIFDLHSKLAAKGNVESIVKLGTMYERGEGVKQNRKKAEALYLQAIDLGSTTARELLVKLKSNKNDTSSTISRELKVPVPKRRASDNSAEMARQIELENKLRREKEAADTARQEMEALRRKQQQELERQRKLKAELEQTQKMQEQLARERAKAEAERKELEAYSRKLEQDLKKKNEAAQKAQVAQQRKPVATSPVQEQEVKTQDQEKQEDDSHFSSNPCNTPAAKFMSTCN